MVQLEGVQKYFHTNGVQALRDVSLSVMPGEIHALLGENGAGKSTLMHIMAGYLRPSAGTMELDGRTVTFRSPADALKAGIGMVRQHPTLVPSFRVWENCILGAEGNAAGFIRTKKMRRLVTDISKNWDFGLPMDRKTESLSVSQRQKAAVLALILRDVRYLIFDEATAVLTPGESESLFRLLRRLRDEGKGIILISHKLEETLSLADRVTVLGKGEVLYSGAASTLGPEDLSSLIFASGEHGLMAAPSSAGPAAAEKFPGRSPSFREGPPVLELRNLHFSVPGKPLIRGVSLDLKPGMILGIAGVRDSGLETLEQGICGFYRPSEGSITARGSGAGGRESEGTELGGTEPEGTELGGRGILAFRRAGGGYLSADRIGTALAPRLSLGDNIIIHAHRRSLTGFPGRLGIMNRYFLNSWTASVLARAAVNRSPKNPAESFSGGMLQRLILAREFAEQTRFLVLGEPGWGLDAPAKRRLLIRLREKAAAGTGILILSTDIDELISAADEILVLRNGEISGHFVIPAAAGRPDRGGIMFIKEEIARAMTGAGSAVRETGMETNA